MILEAVENAAREHGLSVCRIAARVVPGGGDGDGGAAAECFEAGEDATNMMALQLPAAMDSDAAADAARATLLQIRADPS